MEENKEVLEEQKEEKPKQREFRGLYKHVKISVRTLDIIIGVCIAVIVIVVALNMINPGFTVTFDSKGGTDVETVKQDHGELLKVPEDPTREGYDFTGWYKDPGCEELWEEETDVVESSMTLYAGWEKRSSE